MSHFGKHCDLGGGGVPKKVLQLFVQLGKINIYYTYILLCQQLSYGFYIVKKSWAARQTVENI